MLKKLKNFLSKKEKETTLRTNLICPICECELLEHEDYYACSGVLSGVCKFRIPHTFKGKRIDTEILNGIKYFVGYEEVFTKLEELSNLDKLKKRLIRDTEFNYKETRYLECPKCKKNLYRENNIIFCSSKNCDFSINATFMGVSFSDKQIVELFNKRISEEYMFIDEKTGKEVKGRVVLHSYYDYPKGQMAYIFVTDLKQLDQLYLNHYFLPKSQCGGYTPIKEKIKK